LNTKKASSTNQKLTNVYPVSIENMNQKSNQIIIEEIDEDNTENSEETEKLNPCKNDNIDNLKNNLRSKKMNDSSNMKTPFSYYRNGSNNNIFLTEYSNNNLILCEDY
jgi:hypothetical protein